MHADMIRNFDLDAFLTAHPDLAPNERIVADRLRAHLERPHPRFELSGAPACRVCCGAITVLLSNVP